MSSRDEPIPSSRSSKQVKCKVCLVEALLNNGLDNNSSSVKPRIKVGAKLKQLLSGYKNGLKQNERVSSDNEEFSKSDVVFKEPLVPEEGGICSKSLSKIMKNDPNIKVMPSINYSQPSWGCCPPLDKIFKLTEIKNGVIVKKKKLVKPFYSIGRIKCCDIVLMHDSVSRHHAVLQYGSPSGDSKDEGYYIYDMGSMYGVTVNKKLIKPFTFVHLKDGYIFKIAFSTRFFSFDIFNRARRLDNNNDEECAENGINWGQAEDATETLDPCSGFNYFASELEETDSMKTSKRCSSNKTDANILDSSVDIPLEESIKSSVQIKSNHVASRISSSSTTDEFDKQPYRNWEETDYYDDEEDPFFDRTGELEKKRQKRKMKGNKDANTVCNQESLLQELTRLFRTSSIINILLKKVDKELLKFVTRDDDSEEEVAVKNMIENSLRQKLARLNSALIKVDKDVESVSKIFEMIQPLHHAHFIAETRESVSLDDKALASLSNEELSSLEADLGLSLREYFRELSS